MAASGLDALLVAALVAFWTGNAVTGKLMFNRFGERYAFFANQWTMAIYVALCASGAALQLARGAVTAATGEFPQRVLFAVGFLDALATFLSAVGSAHTPGQVQVLLRTTSIPVVMLVSAAALRTRYSTRHKLGAAVIIGGALLAVVPSLVRGDGDGGGGGGGGFRASATLLFALSVLPQAANTVYKEQGFRRYGGDVLVVAAFFTCYQFLLGFAFAPALALPGFGGVALREVPRNMGDGWRCFLGRDSQPEDDCAGAALAVGLYCGVNFFYNMLGLVVYKRVSAVVAAIAGAVQLPLSNLCFTQRWLVGAANVEPFRAWDAAALVVVTAGFLAYNTAPTGDEARPLLAEDEGPYALVPAASDGADGPERL